MIDIGPWQHFQLAVYHFSWFVFPIALAFAGLIFLLRGRSRIAAIAGLALCAVFSYSRYVEPRILLTVEHHKKLARCFPEQGAVKIAVFSDTHYGLFNNVMPLPRIVARLNKIEPDIVFIAGDLTNYLAPERFAEVFAPLSAIKAPAYGVLGNHDNGLPGPDVSIPLTKTLTDFGVRMIDDKNVETKVNGELIEIVGISDLWAGRQKLSLFDGVTAQPRIVLTHNPSTIGRIDRPRQNVDLMIAGHSHGGQIYIPIVTCALVLNSACQTKRYGFKRALKGLVFVTSGTGMVGLPMRFNDAPRIDVIDVNWRACKK